MVEGRLDGMSAFMQGKLQISGDMMAAQAFQPAVEQLREAAEKAGVSPASASSSYPSDIKSAKIFVQIEAVKKKIIIIIIIIIINKIASKYFW